MGHKLCGGWEGYVRHLERRLETIWIGTYKLQLSGGSSSMPTPREKGNQSKGGHYSVVEIVNKVWRVKKAILNRELQEGVDWNGLTFTVENNDIKRLQGCFVGRASSPELINVLQERLCQEGIMSVTVVPVGGDLVLLKPMTREEFGGAILRVEAYHG
ncbi:hypothetical protein VNO78_02624 [Psophocarpus tetragonolobus]|uniref:Uncharacterized protein n=1 Tax=Psophocarpus tetragonolobus TaxID=3891 RepID=A0AAN9SYX9_PSOTE